jgi:hypothetical protein
MDQSKCLIAWNGKVDLHLEAPTLIYWNMNIYSQDVECLPYSWLNSVIQSFSCLLVEGAFQVHGLFKKFLYNEFLWLAHQKRILQLWKLLHIEIFLPTYIRFQEDNIGQSIWEKITVLLGTCWGTQWELGKHGRNLVRTHWEKQIFWKKIQHFLTFPKRKIK